jgi:hypothetical protein
MTSISASARARFKLAIAEDVTWLKLKTHPTRTKLLPKKRGQKRSAGADFESAIGSGWQHMPRG